MSRIFRNRWGHIRRIARHYSTCPSKRNGGSLGDCGPGEQPRPTMHLRRCHVPQCTCVTATALGRSGTTVHQQTLLHNIILCESSHPNSPATTAAPLIALCNTGCPQVQWCHHSMRCCGVPQLAWYKGRCAQSLATI